jgi:hypothetical protein
MLNKIIVVAGLTASLLANGAWAGERGVQAGTGFSPEDRASACSRAKLSADTGAPYGATVTGHSSCDCSSEKVGSQTSWTCTVDAYWGKKMAQEVQLYCVAGDEKHVITFDTETGMLNGEQLKKMQWGWNHPDNDTHISDAEIYISDNDANYVRHQRINRYDGSYEWYESPRNSTRKEKLLGRCSRAKLEF